MRWVTCPSPLQSKIPQVKSLVVVVDSLVVAPSNCKGLSQFVNDSESESRLRWNAWRESYTCCILPRRPRLLDVKTKEADVVPSSCLRTRKDCHFYPRKMWRCQNAEDSGSPWGAGLWGKTTLPRINSSKTWIARSLSLKVHPSSRFSQCFNQR